MQDGIVEDGSSSQGLPPPLVAKPGIVKHALDGVHDGLVETLNHAVVLQHVGWGCGVVDTSLVEELSDLVGDELPPLVGDYTMASKSAGD